MPRRILAGALLLIPAHIAHATVFTNTRSEIAEMAGLWEADSVQISSLVTNQYPALGTNTWEYIFPNNNIAGDGDIHVNMAIDASGTGKNGGNTGNSPIVAEVVNVTSAQLTHLKDASVVHSKTRGIFRFYTEHSNERHYELHPMTELLTWNTNTSTFVLDTNYRPNVTNVAHGASHPNSTLIGVFDGSDTITTTVLADNNRVTINSPAPSPNYVQYDGVTLSAQTNDSVSSYFWFRPYLLTNLVPNITVRCRIVTNTLAATAAAGLFSNQTLTINALTRTDMLVVSNRVAALGASQSDAFARPIELVTLWITNTGAATVPIISNVQATNVTGTAATILWTTDVASDSRVIYGLDPLNVTNVVSVGGSVTSHSVTLTGLVASTVYYFDVSSASAAGSSTDDNGEQHYVFITPGPFDLPLTPAGGLTSSGNPGGSFTPTNQVYNLSNTNASSASWGVTKTAIWLDVAPTNGVLATSSSTNITVSINANADSLQDGSYSDLVIFRNLSSGSLTSRVVNLIVFPLPTLVVTPSSGFDSAGPPGGPFNPASQNYTLRNAGSNTLSWVAGKAASWLDISATSGTLAPGASATVTASINTNANNLAANSYADTVTFTNTTNGVGNTTRPVNLYVTTFGFYDDFSTFATGNLVGQSNWMEAPGSSSLPLQVTNGMVAIPYGQAANNQDAYKDFTQTNITVFYGMSLTVTQTPISTTTSPQAFAALYTSTNATVGPETNTYYRLTAKRGDGGQSNFVFMIRIQYTSADFWTAGAVLNTGTLYRVIVQTSVNGSNMTVYVNPTRSDLASQTPYNTHTLGAGATPPPSVGGFTIQQLFFPSPVSDGVLIGKAVVADNFTTAYNALLGAQPPVASFTAMPASGAAPLSVTFTDTSTPTGSVTNRFWNFGDSSTTNVTTNVVAHVYAAGTYSVTLVVSGPAGVSTNIQSNYIASLTAFESWMVQYFGTTNNPTGDPDGDGLSNQQEYLTGTNPTNSASAFRVQAVTIESNNVRVNWATAGGRTNAVQDSPSVGGSYSDISSNILIPGSGDATTNYLATDGATNQPSHFYRIRLVP